jgi:hypothetical protein
VHQRWNRPEVDDLRPVFLFSCSRSNNRPQLIGRKGVLPERVEGPSSPSRPFDSPARRATIEGLDSGQERGADSAASHGATSAPRIAPAIRNFVMSLGTAKRGLKRHRRRSRKATVASSRLIAPKARLDQRQRRIVGPSRQGKALSAASQRIVRATYAPASSTQRMALESSGER